MAVTITGDVATIITSAATALGVLGNLLLQWRIAKKVDDVKASTDTNRESISAITGKVEEVHKATNSMKDALVAATAKESHAEGVKEGVALEVARASDAAAAVAPAPSPLPAASP